MNSRNVLWTAFFTICIFTLNLTGCTSNEESQSVAAVAADQEDNPQKEESSRPVHPQEPQVVYVNQAGYLPTQEKYFITNQPAHSFTLIKEGTLAPVFEGTVSLWKENDRSTGKTTYIGDFSSIKTEGRYFIKLNTDIVSYSFTIQNDVFNDVARKSIKSFYFQRCGIPLENEYAGQFERDICHISEGSFHAEIGLDGGRNISGGWHDAGDFGKYVHAAAAALGSMMITYEQHPEKYNYDDNGIPESGNGISDFLDEVKYELDWIVKMQNTDPDSEFFGAVNYMVNTKSYVWAKAELDNNKRYIYNYSTVATANFAAILANGYRNLKNLPGMEAAADLYLESALHAWEYLEKQQEIYPKGGYKRPGDTETGGYAGSADSNDKDDRLWAAVELYLSTGEERFHTAALADKRLASATGFNYNPDWSDTTAYALLQYMLADTSTINPDVQQNLRKQFLRRADRILRDVESDGFKDALTRYYWGGNGGVMSLAQYLINAYELTGDQKYYNGALSQLNYLLGINAHNMSFVTKVGTVYPKNIHHAELASDGIDDIYPGMVPGGPTSSINADYTLPKFFTRTTPPALCYVDNIDSWASNENCILYNAPLVAVSAYFSSL